LKIEGMIPFECKNSCSYLLNLRSMRELVQKDPGKHFFQSNVLILQTYILPKGTCSHYKKCWGIFAFRWRCESHLLNRNFLTVRNCQSIIVRLLSPGKFFGKIFRTVKRLSLRRGYAGGRINILFVVKEHYWRRLLWQSQNLR